MVKIWKAKHTAIKLSASSGITLTTTQSLSTFFSTAVDISCSAKNVTVTEPEGDVELINLLGASATLPCSELDKKPYAFAVVTGTLVMDEDENIENVVLGAGDTVTGGYTRYSPSNVDDRQDVTILVQVKDGTEEVAMVLDNGKTTRIGDIRISGPDGHWEQDFRIVCLPRDFYIEYYTG